MSIAFVFPGQGSQFPGMGKDLAETFGAARAVFEEIDEALQERLSRLIFDGPESELNLTANTQPALFAVSMAVLKALEQEHGGPVIDQAAFLAGHSLGEYSALAAAGSLGIADGARVLRQRGAAMQAAVPVGEGAMAAILGLDIDQTRAVAEEAAQGAVCAAANDNAEGQVVISGHAAAVDRAIELAKEAGAKRAVPLAVSAPFHCSLMQPAADRMAEVLATTTLTALKVPVVANVTAQGESDPDRLKQLLVEQVTATVRWRESVQWMAGQGVDLQIELGAGKVLSGLVRRIDKGIASLAAGGPTDLDAVLATLG